MKNKLIPVDLHHHLQTSPDISKLSFNEVVDLIRGAYGDRCVVGITNFRDYDRKGLRDDTRYEDFIKLDGFRRQEYDGHIKVDEIRIIKVQEVPLLCQDCLSRKLRTLVRR